jgi:hypothetical protein
MIDALFIYENEINNCNSSCCCYQDEGGAGCYKKVRITKRYVVSTKMKERRAATRG